MNKAILIGRLTAKPELRYAGGVSTVRFTVAVNRNFTNADGKRDADFINVVAWRKQAETISKFFDKGNLIALEGRLQTGSFNDKDGNKRYTMDVVADNVQFLESKQQSQRRTQDDVSPYDYQSDMNASTGVNIDTDPFADFGDSVSIDDNFLE